MKFAAAVEEKDEKAKHFSFSLLFNGKSNNIKYLQLWKSKENVSHLSGKFISDAGQKIFAIFAEVPLPWPGLFD